MPELEATPHSFLAISVDDQPDARSRRLGLLVLMGACVIVYASVMFGVARAWTWASTHLSSVELLGIAAAVVLAIQVLMTVRETNRLKVSRDITVRGIWGVWVIL
jgi:uncharacterized membrane protein